MLLNKWIKGKIIEEIKILRQKWKQNFLKSMGFRKSSCKKEIYSNTGLPYKTRKIPNKQSNFTPKVTRRRTKPKVSEIIIIIIIIGKNKIET